MTWLPDYLKNLATANYGMWNSPAPGLHPGGIITPGEGGVDIGTPNGTPVYAIADGPVIGAGCWKDSAHCVVTTRVNVPGAGVQDLYYQHIQIAPGIQEGQSVIRGQRIGTIGPYNEIEMGFNAGWKDAIYGSATGNHPGPWIADPRPWLKAIVGGSGAAPSVLDTSTGSTSTSASPATDWVAQLRGEAIKIGLFVLALVLLGFGLYLLFTKQINNAAKTGLKTAAKVALA